VIETASLVLLVGSLGGIGCIAAAVAVRLLRGSR